MAPQVSGRSSRAHWASAAAAGAPDGSNQIAALPAQSLLTGTGPELFDTLDARARRLSITRVNGASAATEA